MAYDNNRGGNRQNNRGGQRRDIATNRPRTENQQISDEQSRAGRNQELIAKVMELRPAIEAVLRSDVTFEKFRATVMMAVRMDPSILDCYGPSIITACLKAAYDGLMPDRREAVILVSNNKYATNPDRWRKEASYRSMVAGLRKQILRSGLVLDVKTVCVYANELFKVTEGLNPDITHERITDAEKRGPFVAAYSVAWLKNGRATFEVMNNAEIEKVRAVAQTDSVWAKWTDEMRRKTVLRRHRKSLPGCNDIVDMEAREMFPQFTGAEPAPALAAPARPTREQFRAIEAPNELVINDFGASGETSGPSPEEVTREEEQPREQRKEAAVDSATTADQPASDQSAQQSQSTAAMPTDWVAWALDVETRLDAASGKGAVDQLRLGEQHRIEAAPAAMRDRVNAAFSDRLADIVAGPGPSDAGSDQGGLPLPAGE